MLTFSVPDMSCGGCANAITRAVQKLDPQAVVRPDLEAKQVMIDTTLAAELVKDALQKAGFPANPQ
jgi:copper chaperone